MSKNVEKNKILHLFYMFTTSKNDFICIFALSKLKALNLKNYPTEKISMCLKCPKMIRNVRLYIIFTILQYPKNFGRQFFVISLSKLLFSKIIRQKIWFWVKYSKILK